MYTVVEMRLQKKLFITSSNQRSFDKYKVMWMIEKLSIPIIGIALYLKILYNRLVLFAILNFENILRLILGTELNCL